MGNGTRPACGVQIREFRHEAKRYEAPPRAIVRRTCTSNGVDSLWPAVRPDRSMTLSRERLVTRHPAACDTLIVPHTAVDAFAFALIGDHMASICTLIECLIPSTSGRGVTRSHALDVDTIILGTPGLTGTTTGRGVRRFISTCRRGGEGRHDQHRRQLEFLVSPTHNAIVPPMTKRPGDFTRGPFDRHNQLSTNALRRLLRLGCRSLRRALASI